MCVYTYMCIRTITCVYVDIYMPTFICIHVCMPICIYVYLSVVMCVYAYTYKYFVYVSTRAHTCTFMFPRTSLVLKKHQIKCKHTWF